MFAAECASDIQPRLLRRLADARVQTDNLFNVVRSDSLYERPIPERHRIIFYIGHVEAFDWNLFRGRIQGLQSFQPGFDELFAFGIDPVDGGLPADRPSDWPSAVETRLYNSRVRDALDRALAAPAIWLPDYGGEFPAHLLLNVAIEHRLMHAETFAYMLHQLPFERKSRPPETRAVAAGPAQAGMVEIPAGTATLGLAREDARPFGWDNEYDAHAVSVPAFAIDRYKVTNGQYLSFLEAGGYEDRALWTEDDWRWKTEQGICQPGFWIRRNNDWHYRAMFGEIPLPLQWPVYVSHAEASAYARWAGKRLPSEAQWHRAAYGAPGDSERPYPWGLEAPGPAQGCFDFERWDPVPVNASPGGRSAFGVEGVTGNGWEWTSTVFEPFKGFQAFPFYPGYSANFFDGKHYVLKGGSSRTAASMLRRSFRNWFQAHYQYVYAGFRLAAG